MTGEVFQTVVNTAREYSEGCDDDVTVSLFFAAKIGDNQDIGVTFHPGDTAEVACCRVWSLLKDGLKLNGMVVNNHTTEGVKVALIK